jgi:Putative zinc-finger
MNPNTNINPACQPFREEFSAYLDGAISGHAMAAIAAHLEGCYSCAEDFEAWKVVQQSLNTLGPALPPPRLQAELRAAIAIEHERGTHLSPLARFQMAWQTWLAPAALRATGGFAVAIFLVGSLVWMFGTPLAVEANDDNMAHLIAPHYLYSEVPPQDIPTDRSTPILVDAMVDTHGQVYDYTIIDGPADPAVLLQVKQNLLASVFKPATLFGAPVRGHVVMTYMGVNVRG